jgi:cytochrome c556
MKARLNTLLAAGLAVGVLATSATVWAQQAPKPEQLIKWRQSAFQVIAWNSGRIRANVEGAYNKDDVVKSANTIAAIANGGLGSLFPAGTESGKGWHDTTVKPAFFTDGARVGEVAGAFSREATELAKVALNSDQTAVKTQLGKLNATCKGCHDDFRNSN